MAEVKKGSSLNKPPPAPHHAGEESLIQAKSLESKSFPRHQRRPCVRASRSSTLRRASLGLEERLPLPKASACPKSCRPEPLLRRHLRQAAIYPNSRAKLFCRQLFCLNCGHATSASRRPPESSACPRSGNYSATNSYNAITAKPPSAINVCKAVAWLGCFGRIMGGRIIFTGTLARYNATATHRNRSWVPLSCPTNGSSNCSSVNYCDAISVLW